MGGGGGAEGGRRGGRGGDQAHVNDENGSIARAGRGDGDVHRVKPELDRAHVEEVLLHEDRTRPWRHGLGEAE